MGADDWHDPYGVIPEEFREEFRDADSVVEALRKAELDRGATPREEKPRCNSCRTVQIHLKRGPDMEHKIDTKYRCDNSHHFDEPRPPLVECPVEHAWKWLDDQQRYRDTYTKTMPISTPFNWSTRSDLKDPADRIPLRSGIDREQAVSIAIRLREPWNDADTLSYTEIAAALPYEDSWVGHRVREWRDGEHRELVPDPSAEPITADESCGPTAVATDGGPRQRRWAAYGSG